ncbi:MAG TPA: alpha/beta fold hydrolase [Actinobacteria bacterium]|nr:alpha/beta fold hydrolase [Actinomycetota bacterium]
MKVRLVVHVARAKRWILLPAIVAAGAVVVTPRLLKRAFAPPQPPPDESPADLGLPEERVHLESVNGTLLHGWYIPVDGSAPGVVVLHGWGSNSALMLPLAPHLHAAGFHVLFIDARNHGLSEHDSFSSMPRFAEDLEVAAEWLRARPEVTAVGVIGHSVGAGAAILAASRGDLLDAVVSVSSFAHPGEMMRRQMDRMPRPARFMILEAVQWMIGFRFDDIAPRKRIAHVEVPVMLVHGDADDVVPITAMHELSAADPAAERLTVPGGGHSDLAPFEPFVGEILDFLKRHLTASDGRA